MGVMGRRGLCPSRDLCKLCFQDQPSSREAALALRPELITLPFEYVCPGATQEERPVAF